MRLSRLAALATAAGFIAVLFYLPLVGILTFSGDLPTAGAASLQKLASVVSFTVGQALVSTALCVLLGFPISYLLYRTRFAGQRFLRAFITVPFILPVLVIAIAFSTFQKSNESFSDITPIALIIAAHVFVNLSLVVRTVGASWQGLSSNLDEAAELDGAGRLRAFLAVSLGALRPALLASATLVFAYTASSFAIVLVLGGGIVNSIETSIYQAALVYLDLKQAGLLALCQLVLTAVAFILSEVFAKRVRLDFTDGQVEAEQYLKPVDRRDWPVVAFGCAVAIFFVLPIWNVFQKAFTFGDKFSLQNFLNLTNDRASRMLDISLIDALGNSVRNSAIACIASMVIGTWVAWLLARTKPSIFTRLLDFAYLAPLGVSTVLLGLGYLVTFSTEPFALRSSWLVVPLVETLLALPLVIRMVYSALASIDTELLWAAQLDGAGRRQLFWFIEVPLIRSTLEVAAGFAAIISLGDFGASSFLAFGDQETLPLVLYRLFSHPGAENFGMAMALSALLIAVTCAVLLAISLRVRRTGRQS